MKVLDLQCAANHRFEGWFASEAEFQEQLKRHLLQCPVCGTTAVTKRLSAPRLNLVSARRSALTSVDAADASKGEAILPVPWLATLRQWVASAEDVGDRFAQEARSIHYGEADERAIRGQATPAQTRELQDEGIGVLPLPKILTEPLH